MTTEKKLLTAALEYAAQGFPVFPLHNPISDDNGGLTCSCGKPKCPRGAKHPRTGNGFKDASTDADSIKKWWSLWPDANIGIPTGKVSGIDVVDLDTEQANKKLKELIPDTSTVALQKTGRGWQLGFAHVDSELTTASAINGVDGLDFRGTGGYIVAAPSRHINGKFYAWVRPLSDGLLPLPQSFIKFASPPINPRTGFKERFDSSVLWEGVPHGKRDEQIFKYACQLRANNAPRDVAAGLVAAAAARCKPPFDEWQEKLEQAWKYSAGKKRGQTLEQQADFWPKPSTIQEVRAASEAGISWLWDQALPLGAVSMIAGEPRAGKSTLSLNITLAISRGIPFLGRKTQQAQCLYVSIDNNVDDMRLIIDQMGIRDEDKILMHLGPVPDRSTEWLIETIKEAQAKFVVVDTYQRFFNIVEINSSECVPKMSPMDFAVKDLGCHLQYLHHATCKPGRETHKLAGFMGNTGIKGMCPYYFEYIRVGDGQQHRVLLSDLRNGRQFDEVYVKVDRRTGWGVNAGNVEDAYIEDATRKIVEFFDTQKEATEPQIRESIPGRGIIASKALRKLYKEGSIARRGEGRKGDPFLYSLAMDILSPSYSSPVVGNGSSGLETVLPSQVAENTPKDSSPDLSGLAGTRNAVPGASGLESEVLKNEAKKQPENDDEKGWSKAR